MYLSPVHVLMLYISGMDDSVFEEEGLIYYLLLLLHNNKNTAFIYVSLKVRDNKVSFLFYRYGSK